ncbi:hypothetical protein WN944_010585 [Citrus x changshan-huyou]|uniref:Uncharacterized protein n=1 Tax=Citrus x changshan-huyou TaxID=2935761 RepID=A0AAP0MWN3_9ROSI
MPTNGDRISTDGDGKLKLDSFGRAESNGGGGDLSRVVMAGNRGKQNSSDSVTGNRRNRGELKRQFRGFSRLQSAAFRTLFGDKIGMEMTGIARSSDRYQPWPVKWPKMEIASRSGLWVRHGHFGSERGSHSGWPFFKISDEHKKRPNKSQVNPRFQMLKA